MSDDDGIRTVALGGTFTEPPLALTEHEPGLFFTSTGEALDLTRTPPTYANIQLRKV